MREGKKNTSSESAKKINIVRESQTEKKTYSM